MKKTYIQPQMDVVEMELSQVIATSARIYNEETQTQLESRRRGNRGDYEDL